LYKCGCQTILFIIKEIKTMRKDTGFSLIELITVMAILSLLCTFAIPSLFEWLPKHRVGSAARDVKSTLEFARSNAIKTNRDVRVEFDFDSETATLTVIEVVDPIVPVENTLRTRQLPGDVDLQDKGLGTAVTFNGHGFCSESGQVDVENRTNTALRRSINLTIGGNSRIQ
jgi:prepilin-type N-terminal cleavage/methylation domain-containing protein